MRSKKEDAASAVKDLLDAVEVVLAGKEKKDRVMNAKERKIVSYHEVGHALIGALQKNSEPIRKITIVPRTMGSLGYVMSMPEEEKFLETKEELLDELVKLVAGRAAEEIVFGNVTNGAGNDIERATNLAKGMITQYGMSDKFGLMVLATVENQYLDGRASLNCSDVTAAEVDKEVKRMLDESYEKALSMLRENRDVMDKLADYLIEKETITGKEFMRIYRQAKGLPEEPQPVEEKSVSQEATATTPQATSTETEAVPEKSIENSTYNAQAADEISTTTDENTEE